MIFSTRSQKHKGLNIKSDFDKNLYFQTLQTINTIRLVLPFKDQIAANAICRQLRDLSGKIGATLQPIFVSKKLEQDLKPKEIKPSIVSQHCVVYKFACDLCDADYVGYTVRHLHQRIAEHKYSAIGKHLLDARGDKNLINEDQFRVLKKCHGEI